MTIIHAMNPMTIIHEIYDDVIYDNNPCHGFHEWQVANAPSYDEVIDRKSCSMN